MIELLPTTGCTGAELIAKINEIIAVVNGMSNVTSYNDLTDKPSINGVSLVGDKLTGELQIAMDDLTDYDTQMQSIATKAEVAGAESRATAAATAAVQEQIAGKLDKIPTTTPETDMIGDGTYIYVSDGQTSKKVKLETITKNVGYKLTESKIVSGGSGKPLTATVQVKVAEWESKEDGYIATVNLPGMTKTALVQASATPESMDVWMDTPFYLSEVKDNAVVLFAETKPAEAVGYNLLFWK